MSFLEAEVEAPMTRDLSNDVEAGRLSDMPVRAACTTPRSGARLTRQRLQRAKKAYVTRRVKLSGKIFLKTENVVLEAGDLVLARVTSLGQHKRIELPTGRRAHLYPGDEIIVACGARYAADQFESTIPRQLGQCSLVAAGGIASTLVSKHNSMKRPTRIELIGALGDQNGETLNLRRWALASPHQQARTRAHVIAVAGASMNAGKTTMAASIIHGLTRSGLTVASCKLTGTGSGCDAWRYLDAGAASVLDFTDAGYASTAGLPAPALESVARLLLQASDQDVHVIVAEIADGLLQEETRALMDSVYLRQSIDSLVFAAGESMAVCSGVGLLRKWGYEPSAVGGVVTTSPLAAREVEAAIDVPVVTSKWLENNRGMASVIMRPAFANAASKISDNHVA